MARIGTVEVVHDCPPARLGWRTVDRTRWEADLAGHGANFVLDHAAVRLSTGRQDPGGRVGQLNAEFGPESFSRLTKPREAGPRIRGHIVRHAILREALGK